MKSVLIFCGCLLIFNLLLLEKGDKAVLNCKDTGRREFLIEVGKEE